MCASSRARPQRYEKRPLLNTASYKKPGSGSLKHDPPPIGGTIATDSFSSTLFASQDGWRGFSSSQGFFEGGYLSPPADFAAIRPLYPESVLLRRLEDPFRSQWGRVAATSRYFSSLILFFSASTSRCFMMYFVPLPYFFSQILGYFKIRFCIGETRSGSDSRLSSSSTPAVLPPCLAIHPFQITLRV